MASVSGPNRSWSSGQSSIRRYCMGLTPTCRRNVVMKWERLLNPTRWQICATVSIEARRSSAAQLIRSRIRYRYGGTPYWALKIRVR